MLCSMVLPCFAVYSWQTFCMPSVVPRRGYQYPCSSTRSTSRFLQLLRRSVQEGTNTPDSVNKQSHGSCQLCASVLRLVALVLACCGHARAHSMLLYAKR